MLINTMIFFVQCAMFSVVLCILLKLVKICLKDQNLILKNMDTTDWKIKINKKKIFSILYINFFNLFKK